MLFKVEKSYGEVCALTVRQRQKTGFQNFVPRFRRPIEDEIKIRPNNEI